MEDRQGQSQPSEVYLPGAENRRNSMRSSYSIVSEVEMARSEVYDGPISESIPSSVVSFSHRRDRKDSTTSFTYFHDDDDHTSWPPEDALDVESDMDDVSVTGLNDTNESIRSSKRQSYSRGSVEDPLLRRSLSVASYAQNWTGESITSQKVHIISEDLTIVIAGFSTSITGLVLYYISCALSFGFAYLLFRWFPKWRVRLLGKPAPLCACKWVAIEDQWNRFQVQQVDSQDYGRPLSTIFADPDCHSYDEDNDPAIAQLRRIDYRYLRFFYNPLEDKFCLVNGWKDPLWTNVKGMRLGLDADDRDDREQIFGKNLIDIQQKPAFQLLMDEAFHPFYIFQLASLVLWSLDEYYYYAVCIFLISLISIGATVIETKATMNRLRELSLFECDTRVLRNGFWRSIPSRELVPGDVYEFSDPSLTQVPCDCILLSGDCIVNESMLTGESVPVTKLPLTDDALKYLNLTGLSINPNLAKHFLFSGTKVIRARRPQNVDDDEAIALAVVVRTGFLTTKGALIRSMLFPKPSGFKFYRDSFRYISVMGIIAILGFIASFVNFIRLGLPWQFIIVRALDLITIVVPPALPATLSIGTNFALSRLKNHKIFCISPQRVNVGGKLDIICFDKTGTLTEDGLDVLGIRVADQNASFSGLISTIYLDNASLADRRTTLQRDTRHDNILYTMATCHSLRVVDGELLGDPLDVKMFQFTGWSFIEGGSHVEQSDSERIMPSIAKPPEPTDTLAGNYQEQGPHAHVELGILRNFEFVSELRRASVIVRRFRDSGASTFVKGAPESVKAICRPGSLPRDYDELLSYYTHKGYRVIACAAKHAPKLSWMKIQKMTRHDAECDLEFLGFIIFENKLKPKTAGTITELNQAGIRNVMCTGDNILTAVSVARECGLVSSNEHCFVPHFSQGHGHDTGASLCWESVDDPAIRLDSTTLMPHVNAASIDLSVPGNVSNLNNYSLAVSGEVFRWAIDFGSETILNRILVRGSVFARMSPDEKHELVEKLQSLDYCCGFCGDGANDCGALKAADVGISLSDAEASVAAPFTSRQFDISCVPTLIREGRGALVTSFCCFKYMSLYSAIQFATVSLLYASASNLGDFQFLFIDLFLILPIAIFMGWTDPHPILSRKRPTADLVSRKVLIPLLGQITLCVATQLVAYKYVQLQPWFNPPRAGLEDNIENSANTVLFLISSFQYILSSVVLSAGPPFRKPMISNKPYLIMVLMTLLFSCYMLFRPTQWLRRVMQLTSLPDYFAWQLLAVVSGSFLIAWTAERRIFPSLARKVGKLRQKLQPGQSKKRRQYKMLLEEMRN